MTQLVILVHPHVVFLVSDSLWSSESGATFDFRKVFSCGDHLLAACGYGAANQMTLDITNNQELHPGSQHEEIGKTLRSKWSKYAFQHQNQLIATNISTTFIVLSRAQDRFILTEWTGMPGEGVTPYSCELKSVDFRVIGPLTSTPPVLQIDNFSPYYGATYPCVSGLNPRFLNNNIRVKALEDALQKSIDISEMMKHPRLGLPMTGWCLPLVGLPFPIGPSEIGGIGPDSGTVLREKLEAVKVGAT